MGLLDRRTELLTPAIESSERAVAAARADWASHLGVTEDALLAMLAHLRFRTGRPYAAELERAASLMWGHGLATGPNALDSALAFIREWVQDRWRTVGVAELRDRVRERIGRGGDPGALLVIEAIDDDPHPEDATERLRWVDRYEGADANLRRQLSDPRDWEHVIGPELEAAAQRMRAAAHRRILVRGALRLPVWFAAGAALRHVRGFDVAGLQHGAIWSSDAATGTELRPDATLEHVDAGPDIAIAIGVAADPTLAVTRFIRDQALPVGGIGTLWASRRDS